MKRIFIQLFVFTAVCLVPLYLLSQDKPSRPPMQPETILGTPTVLPMNINKMFGRYNSNGNQEYPAPLFNGGGLTYPKGTATAVFASGILWGGKVREADTSRLHVNGQYYTSGTRQGAKAHHHSRSGESQRVLVRDVTEQQKDCINFVELI